MTVSTLAFLVAVGVAGGAGTADPVKAQPEGQGTPGSWAAKPNERARGLAPDHTAGEATVDGVDQLLLDAQGRETGLIAWIDGIALQINSSPEGVVSAPGMGPVMKVSDANGKLVAIGGPAGVMVSFSYGIDGVLDHVAVPGVAELRLQYFGKLGVEQTLVSASGEVLAKSTTPTGFGALEAHFLNLDPVALDLGLTPDWEPHVRQKWNESGTAAKVTDLDDNPLLFVAVYGQVLVGFDLAGNALFYELDLSPELLDAGASGQTLSRVLVTSDGRVGVSALVPQIDALAGFWSTLNEDGEVLIHARTVRGGLAGHANETDGIAVRLQGPCM